MSEIVKMPMQPGSAPASAAIDPAAPPDSLMRAAASAAQHMSEALILTDPQGVIEWLNPQYERLTGYSAAELKGKRPGDVMCGPGSDPIVFKELRAAMAARRAIVRRIMKYRRDGSTFWTQCSIAPVFDDTGKHTHFAALYYDISEYKAIEDQIIQQQQLAVAQEQTRKQLTMVSQWLYAARTIEELCDIIRTGIESLFPQSEGALYVYRHSRDRLEARTHWGAFEPTPSIPAHECWAMRRGQAHIFGGGAVNMRCEHDSQASVAPAICTPLLAQGETIGLLHVRFPHIDADPYKPCSELFETLNGKRRILLLLSEQTGLAIANIELRDELEAQSTADALTGLPNRRKFFDEARECLAARKREGAPFSLLSVDVDHFKSINDRYGHGTGDAVLKRVAKAMTDLVGDDGLVVRYGGEEFFVMPYQMSSAEARALGQRLVDTIRQTFASTSELPDVTISVGFASIPEHAPDLSSAMQRADDALYRAKRVGRDRMVSFDDPVETA